MSICTNSSSFALQVFLVPGARRGWHRHPLPGVQPVRRQLQLDGRGDDPEVGDPDFVGQRYRRTRCGHRTSGHHRGLLRGQEIQSGQA